VVLVASCRVKPRQLVRLTSGAIFARTLVTHIEHENNNNETNTERRMQTGGRRVCRQNNLLSHLLPVLIRSQVVSVEIR